MSGRFSAQKVRLVNVRNQLLKPHDTGKAGFRSNHPYLRVHLLQLILQLIQLRGTKAFEDGILINVPGVWHGSWGCDSHIHTHTHTHCCAPLGKRALPVKKGGKEERTINLYTLLSKIFFLSYLGFFYCVLFPTLFYLSCAVTYYVRNSYNNISFIVKSLALTVNHARQRSDWVLF